MQISHALKILEEHNLPSNLFKHVIKVTQVCSFLSDFYPKVNRRNLICAAILHDLFKLAGNDHSKEIYTFLNGLLEPQIAEICYKHDFDAIIDPKRCPITLEEKILSYADKRVKHDQIVSLKERFNDFKLRYNPDDKDPEWIKEAQSAYFKLEKELLEPLNLSSDDIKEENLKDFEY